MATVMVEKSGKDVGGFWKGKTPCWDLMGCPESVRDACFSARVGSVPCWEVQGTYVKLDDRGADGCDTTVCAQCPVYLRWGNGATISVTVRGQGICTSLACVKGPTGVPIGR